MVNCCAFRCPNRSEKKEEDITFHRFPVDAERRSEWVKNVRLLNWVPSKNDRICSAHFEEHYFRRTSSTMRLLAQAVPTIFKTYPSYLQPKTGSKRARTRRGELAAQPGPSGLQDAPRKVKLRRQLLQSKLSSQQKTKQINVLSQSLKFYKKKRAQFC